MINVSERYKELIYDDSTKVNSTVEYGAYDVTGSSKASASANASQTYTQPSSTIAGNSQTQTYTTFEQNEWILDGNTKLFPNTKTSIDYGWWSGEISNSNGTFSTNPKLTFTWNENHTSIGLTIITHEPIFQFNVKWYSGTTLLDTYECNNEEGNLTVAIENGVEDYNKIEIEVIKVLPYHYAKIKKVAFGITFIFDNEIINYTITEELDIKGQTITSNQATLSLNNIDGIFDKYNPNNKLRYLQQNQIMQFNTSALIDDVYEQVPLGTFYLTSWSSPTRYTTEFIANDITKKLEGIYYKSKFYTNATVTTIIQDIIDDYNSTIDDADLLKIVLADNVKNVTLTGYIKAISYREAIQQVCFSVGAVCKVDRLGQLYIYRLTTSDAVETIDNTKKQFALDKESERYSEVGISCYEYTEGDEVELYNGSLTGTQKILFDTPIKSITSITGTYTNYTLYPNCLVINGCNGNILVKGKQYNSYSRTISASYTTTNLAKLGLNVEGITLIGKQETAEYCASWLINVLQKYITNEFKWLGNPAIELGDFVKVSVSDEMNKTAIITKNQFTYNGALLEQSEVTL